MIVLFGIFVCCRIVLFVALCYVYLRTFVVVCGALAAGWFCYTVLIWYLTFLVLVLVVALVESLVCRWFGVFGVLLV